MSTIVNRMTHVEAVIQNFAQLVNIWFFGKVRVSDKTRYMLNNYVAIYMEDIQNVICSSNAPKIVIIGSKIIFLNNVGFSL